MTNFSNMGKYKYNCHTQEHFVAFRNLTFERYVLNKPEALFYLLIYYVLLDNGNLGESLFSL